MTSTPESATCDICCYEFNKSTRKPTSCTFCEFTMCVSCLKQYTLTLFGEPHCMSCKRGFLREHMVAMFPKSFIINEYKRHRENILHEREKCMLPATQARMEIDDEKQKFTDLIKTHCDERIKLYEELQKIRYVTTKIQNGVYYTYRQTPRETTVEEQARISQIYGLLTSLHLVISNLKQQRYRAEISNLGTEQVKDKEERRQFVKKCPGEDCNGFLSTQWKCSLCNLKVCNKCLEVKPEDETVEHFCNPENVKTAELINSDSKGCPGCGTCITKLHGCSQMWCPQCHVAFDWRTLRIVTGVVHNPHYYEYQRSINGGVAPRTPGDIPGGGCDHQVPSVWSCSQIWNRNGIDRKLAKYMSDLHRLMVHIQHQEIPALPTGYNARENEDVRRRFLRNHIDEARLRWFLQKREKLNSKKREVRQLYEMFVACCQDFIRKSVLENINNEEFMSILDQFKSLCKYFEESAYKIYETYGGVVPYISFAENTEYDHGASWCVLVSRYV